MRCLFLRKSSTTARFTIGRRLLAFFLLAFCAIHPQETSPAQRVSASHTIVFMTDFGLLDDSVGICKAVMLGVDPDVRIMDITHQVTPFSVLDGARFLSQTTSYYKPGTVFVVVIDPGVGSARKPVVAKSRLGQFFVLPDNGLLTMVADREGITEAREITNPQWMIGSKLSSTFHGRDIFSPVGARLARGDDWTQVGPAVPIATLVRLDIKPAAMEAKGLSGEIIATDGPYGNLITNIDSDLFAQLGYRIGDQVQLRIANNSYTLPFVRTFSDVPKGELLLYVDSRGHLAIAVNQGNAQSRLQVVPPCKALFLKKG